MPLRLRRGTDTERQLITPQEGEPIYVTDTKSLWIGDGVTPGGFKASGAIPENLDDLSDINLSVAPQIGQVLKWDGSAFVAADDVGTTLTLESSSIGDLGDVDISSTTPALGQVLKWNGTAFVPEDDSVGSSLGITEGTNYRINIIGDDSSVIVDTNTNTLTGLLIGNVVGDIQGSIFSDNSTLLVDGVSNQISNGIITLSENILKVDSTTLYLGDPLKNIDITSINSDVLSVQRSNYDGSPNILSTINIEGSRGTKISPETLQEGDFIGNYLMSAYTGVEYEIKLGFLGQIDTSTGTNPLPSKIIFLIDDYEGNLSSGVSINSRHHLEAPVMKFTPYTDATARDAAIPSGVVEAGMVIYLTDTNKLQINTDGTTSGWVNLH